MDRGTVPSCVRTARGRPALLTQGARGHCRQRGRAARFRHQEGRARFGRPGPRAGHVVRGPVPHVPRQHRRQRRAGQRPERPARGSHLVAMGGQRLCADVRQLHVGGRDARRHLRPQARHARRGRHLLWWFGRGGAGGQRRLADRRPRRSWGSAPPPASPAPCPSSGTSTPIGRPGPTRWASGPRCRASLWPSAPSSGASWSASRAGVPSSGSTWDSVSSRSSWRPSPSPRHPTARGAASTSWGSSSALRSWPVSRSP